MKDADLEQMAGPEPEPPEKVAPKFTAAKIKRQIRRVEAERKEEREADAYLNLALKGILNPDGSWKF